MQDVFGSGRSKKDAEHLAAKAALVIFAEKGYIPARGLLDQQVRLHASLLSRA